MELDLFVNLLVYPQYWDQNSLKRRRDIKSISTLKKNCIAPNSLWIKRIISSFYFSMRQNGSVKFVSFSFYSRLHNPGLKRYSFLYFIVIIFVISGLIFYKKNAKVIKGVKVHGKSLK